MATLKRKTNNGYEPLPAMVVRKTNAENGNGIGTCTTSSGTALEVTLSDYNLVQNGIVAVTFSNDVPASATLNINGKGAKPIIYKGSAIEADVIKADDTVMFCYNGSQYVVTSLGGGGAAPVNPNETVNISLTQVGGSSEDLTGAAITITDDDSGDTLYTGTWAGTMLTTEIDVNTNYTVSVETITGYKSPANQSYQAGYQIERSITFQYAALGVFIEATDGVLYTNSTWSGSGKTANSVVLITSTYSYRISLSARPVLKVGEASDRPAITPCADEASALTDFNGESNTLAYMAIHSETTYAPAYCYNFVFPDGVHHGYLGAYGEMKEIYNNKTDINNALSVCGGSPILSNSDIRTSTSTRANLWQDQDCFQAIRNNGSMYPFETYTITECVPICRY